MTLLERINWMQDLHDAQDAKWIAENGGCIRGPAPIRTREAFICNLAPFIKPPNGEWTDEFLMDLLDKRNVPRQLNTLKRTLTISERWVLQRQKEADLQAKVLARAYAPDADPLEAMYTNVVQLMRYGTEEEQHQLLDQHQIAREWDV